MSWWWDPGGAGGEASPVTVNAPTAVAEAESPAPSIGFLLQVPTAIAEAVAPDVAHIVVAPPAIVEAVAPGVANIIIAPTAVAEAAAPAASVGGIIVIAPAAARPARSHSLRSEARQERCVAEGTWNVRLDDEALRMAGSNASRIKSCRVREPARRSRRCGALSVSSRKGSRQSGSLARSWTPSGSRSSRAGCSSRPTPSPSLAFACQSGCHPPALRSTGQARLGGGAHGSRG